MKVQPQLLHVCSNGLYNIRKARQLLADQLCKNLAQAPSTLSLWVECSRFDKKLQTPTSPSGRKVWEVWGLLAKPVPSPTAQRPASAGPATTSQPARQHGGSPSTHVLLAAGTEESRRGGRSSPLVVCWCCSPGCPIPPPLPWQLCQPVLSIPPENLSLELAASQTKMWWLVFCLTSGSISETPGGSNY